MTIKNALGFGENVDSNASAIGIAGEKNRKLQTISMENMSLFQNILKELKKFNIQLEIITQTKLTDKDARNYRKRI